jgi:sugar lactone lactonase YvrE
MKCIPAVVDRSSGEINRSSEMRKRNIKDGPGFVGRMALLAALLLSLAGFAQPLALAQVPSAVFSASAANLGQTAKVYPTIDGLAGAYRIAVNSRGDTFWLDANYAGTSQTLIEVPAGSPPGNASQVPLIINVYRSSGTAYIDANQNLWVAEYNGNLIYVPFLNNAYPAAFDATKLTACVLPLTTVTAPCNFTKMDTSAYGYYVNASDLFLDASGDIFMIDRQAGTFIRILETVLGRTSTAPVTNTVVTNLPFNSTPGNIVVNTNGDIYYADRTNLYYIAAGTGNNSVTLPGFKNPTGLTFDSAGNLYVTDTGNSRIAVIPRIGSALSVSNTYTVANVLANGGVAIDKYGNLTYSTGNGTTGYVTSIVQLPVGSRNFGSIALGSSSAATELDLAFPVGVTFGSFTLVGGSGTVPFALTANGCVKGTAYTVGASCSVTMTYTPSADGPQYGAMLAYDNLGTFLGSASLSGSGMGSLLNVDPGTVSAIGSSWKAPASIAVDSARNTYVADSTTGAIYKNGNATPIVSGFNAPSAVVVDGGGNLYVADSGNSRIMRVPYGNNAYGTPLSIYTGLSGSSGLALDAAGNLYIADSGNARVILLAASAGYPIGTISSTIGSGYTKPVAVALDAAGNVYVADDGAKTVVEWILDFNTKTTIVTGLTTAGGIAFDPGGSLFVVDKGKKTITRIPSVAGVLSSNSSTVLSTIVSSPVALAIDTSGNVYAADTVDATAGTMVRTTGSLNYGPVVQTVASQPLTAVISNAGTASLVFSSPYYSATGSTTAFAIQSSSTCANGGTLATGTTCTLSAIFTPPAVAAYSETLVFAGNAASSSLVLSGTGVILVNAAITGPTTLTYGYGATTFAVTATHDGSYNVNITGASTATVPITVTNGAASFTLPTLGVGAYTIALAGAVGTASLSVTPATLTLTAANASRSFGIVNPAFTVTASGTKNGDSYVLSGTSVATITSPTGSYPIVPSASGPGLSNYNLVLVNGVLTVTSAASTTTQTVTSSNAFIQGGTVTFSASVKATLPAVGTPTGTVTFENATYPGTPVALGTGTIANGVATFQTTALPTGTIAVIAVYSGDTNFAGSSTAASTTVTIGVPNFTLQISQGQGALVSVLPMTISRGQTGSATLTVTPVGPFTQPVSFYCLNLPLEASCSFFNSTLTPAGGPVTATVVISTTAAASASLTGGQRPWKRSEGGALLALMVGTCVSLRRKRRLAQRLCALLLVSAAVLIPISGCGLTETPFVTPLGVSQVTITATSAPIATQQSVTVRLAVTQ